MKKIIGLVLLVAIGLVLTGSFAEAKQKSRPTLEYLVIYDDNREMIVEAESFDEAVRMFRWKHKNPIIRSVAHRSYVRSIWIWK